MTPTNTQPRAFRILDQVVSDRGSRYAVSGGPCRSGDEARLFVTDLRSHKRFSKATHHSWALLTAEAPLKADDGEAGAGAVILRMLERAELRDHIVVVTRWYGGRPLGGDRFRHIQTAVRAYLETL